MYFLKELLSLFPKVFGFSCLKFTGSSCGVNIKENDKFIGNCDFSDLWGYEPIDPSELSIQGLLLWKSLAGASI